MELHFENLTPVVLAMIGAIGVLVYLIVYLTMWAVEQAAKEKAAEVEKAKRRIRSMELRWTAKDDPHATEL